MADFTAKAGDRLPAIRSQLLDGMGDPVDLTDATVAWRMRALEEATPIVDAAGEVVDPPTEGRVRYWWAAGDLDEPGLYVGEWRVTFGDGRVQTYPGARQLVVEVTPAVADAPLIGPADLAWLREWVGSTPDDAALAARLEAYNGVRTLAALGLLRMRRADLLADPLSYSIRGDVTVNAAGNLSALDAMIASLEAIAIGDGDLELPDSVAGAQLERQDTWGRGYPKGVDLGWRRVTS